MIVLIGSQKGGCGKSTIAVNLCAELAMKNQDTILVDADRQSTAANWIMDRTDKTNLPKVHCIQKYENIRDTLIDLGNRYKYVIVDSAGRDSRELRTGMTTSNIFLVPFRPSQPDLDTLLNLREIVIQARDFNPDLIIYGVITMASTNPVVNETSEAMDFFRDYPEFHLLSTVIMDRKIYRDAMSEGMGVVEMGNKKAVTEIQSLAREVFSWQ